jgi:glycosyltransferase involved in cell wall biosynthesis
MANDPGRGLASVVINNHNYGRFLGDAIDSALGQTYADTEVIIVDDGSTDDSREVIARVGDRIVPVLKPNGGQASALNAGFSASRGDVVVFLDADDVLLPGAIESVMPHFGDREVAKVHWSMPVIDAAGVRTGEIEEPELRGGDLREEVRVEGPLGDATLPSAPTSGNAWSRRFLERVMPVPEGVYASGADTYLFGLAPIFGRIVVLDKPQSLYRLHGSNAYSGALTFKQMDTLERRWLENLQVVAAKVYRDAGLKVDLAEWRRRSWWGRIDLAIETILELVAEGECFLLADQDSWATDPDFYGRRRVPFPELDGEYGGIPADDAAAISELERWRASGAVAIFFAWPAHWWLEDFPELARHLVEHYRALHRDERLIAFDLRS